MNPRSPCNPPRTGSTGAAAAGFLPRRPARRRNRSRVRTGRGPGSRPGSSTGRRARFCRRRR
eukprot:31192-Pelagococcus_subviridis.AAC.4